MELLFSTSCLSGYCRYWFCWDGFLPFIISFCLTSWYWLYCIYNLASNIWVMPLLLSSTELFLIYFLFYLPGKIFYFSQLEMGYIFRKLYTCYFLILTILKKIQKVTFSDLIFQMFYFSFLTNGFLSKSHLSHCYPMLFNLPWHGCSVVLGICGAQFSSHNFLLCKDLWLSYSSFLLLSFWLPNSTCYKVSLLFSFLPSLFIIFLAIFFHQS